MPHTANAIGGVDFTKGRDPTNTRRIERAFLRDIHRRFKRLRGLIRTTVGYENDAFGLTANADPREAFNFLTEDGLTMAFISWLRDAIREELLAPVGPVAVENGDHWTAEYIREAFVQGVNQSTGLLLQRGVSIDNLPDEDIPARPIFATTLKDLYQRTYSNLQSITQDMAPQVRETLTRGFAEGWNPRKMATELNRTIDSLEKTRAQTLARSETINAHSTAALRNYRRAGVNVVNHAVWSAADDARTCPFCNRLDGVSLTLDEVESGAVSWAEEPGWKPQVWRLQPPAHPNCRCVLRPAVGADAPEESLGARLNDADEAFAERLELQSGG